jgi:hypothetical protein
LTNSGYENNALPLTLSYKVEYDCNMTSVIWNPILQGKEKSLIVANDNYKIRVIMTSNELFTKQTCLGPSYGGPIKKLQVVPGYDKDKRLLAFSTTTKVKLNNYI